jgi:serine/threonine-protein kinase RsbW
MHIQLLNRLDELNRLAVSVDQVGEDWKIPLLVIQELNLVLEELFANIIFYAYDDRVEHKIDIVFENPEPRCIRISVSDDGKAFNPLEKSTDDDLGKPLEERREGGLGIHFVKNLVNKKEYQRKNGKNVILLIRNW